MLTPTQRFRDAIDSRIAEEQARQKTAQENLSRSKTTRRPGQSTAPGQRARPRRNTGTSTPVRGPDPKEFEPEFAIGDDEGSSRSGTPRVETPDVTSEVTTPGEADRAAQPEAKTTADDAKESSSQDAPVEDKPVELPPDVKARLRRLDKLESRYQGKLDTLRRDSKKEYR